MCGREIPVLPPIWICWNCNTVLSVNQNQTTASHPTHEPWGPTRGRRGWHGGWHSSVVPVQSISGGRGQVFPVLDRCRGEVRRQKGTERRQKGSETASGHTAVRARAPRGSAGTSGNSRPVACVGPYKTRENSLSLVAPPGCISRVLGKHLSSLLWRPEARCPPEMLVGYRQGRGAWASEQKSGRKLFLEKSEPPHQHPTEPRGL